MEPYIRGGGRPISFQVEAFIWGADSNAWLCIPSFLWGAEPEHLGVPNRGPVPRRALLSPPSPGRTVSWTPQRFWHGQDHPLWACPPGGGDCQGFLGCGRSGLPLGQVWGDTPVQKRLLKAEIQNQSGRGLDPPNIHTHTQHDLDPAAPVASPQGRRIEARARPVHRGDPGGPQRRAPATSGRALTSGRCPASPGGPRAQLARPRDSDRRLGPRPASEQLTWRRCKPRPHERAGGRANEREAGRGGAWEGVAGRVT